MGKISIIAIAITGVMVGMFLPRIFLVPHDLLEEAALWGTVITGVAAVMALITYLYQRDKDTTAAAIDQIALYRKEALPKVDEFLLAVKAKYPDYTFPRARITTFEMVDWELENPEVALQQTELIKKERKEGVSEIITLQIHALNILEEFALRISQTGTSKAEALVSIRPVFVSTIELSAAAIFSTYIYWGTTYPGIKKLYQEWRDLVDGKTAVERLAIIRAERKRRAH